MIGQERLAEYQRILHGTKFHFDSVDDVYFDKCLPMDKEKRRKQVTSLQKNSKIESIIMLTRKI